MSHKFEDELTFFCFKRLNAHLFETFKDAAKVLSIYLRIEAMGKKMHTVEKKIERLEAKKTKMINDSCWTKDPVKIKKISFKVDKLQDQLNCLYFKLV